MELILAFSLGLVLAIVIALLAFKYVLKAQENKFQVLASEILEKNSTQWKVSATENLSSVVNPLNEKIKE